MKQNALATIGPCYAAAALVAAASGLGAIPAFLIFWIGGAALTLLFAFLTWRRPLAEDALDVEAETEAFAIACARWEEDRRAEAMQACDGVAAQRAG